MSHVFSSHLDWSGAAKGCTDVDKTRALVEKAHRQCFIGNSVSAAVDVEPDISFAAEAPPISALRGAESSAATAD